MNKTLIIKMQDVLDRELDRLDNDTYMNVHSKEEVVRSSAISQSANTIIKTIGLNMKIMKMAENTNTTIEELNDKLGITTKRRKVFIE